MVMLEAIDNEARSWGLVDTRLVRLDRSGELPRAAVRFIICAEALAVRAAMERSLLYIMKTFFLNHLKNWEVTITWYCSMEMGRKVCKQKRENYKPSGSEGIHPTDYPLPTYTPFSPRGSKRVQERLVRGEVPMELHVWFRQDGSIFNFVIPRRERQGE